MKYLILSMALIGMLINVKAQTVKTQDTSIMKQNDYPKSLCSYNDFKNLVAEVEPYRAERLISLDTFIKMSKEENVVILDTRSDFRYKRKHLKGAIHLNFSDFTQENLWELILPKPNIKILIYCNNNFSGDQIELASKVAIGEEIQPTDSLETQITGNKKPIMLALNIPTYINLYGYGYRNIYELDELVNVNDPRIEFVGTVVE